MKKIDEFTMEDSLGTSRRDILRHSLDAAKRHAEMTGDLVKAVSLISVATPPHVDQKILKMPVVYRIAVYGETQLDHARYLCENIMGHKMGPNHLKVLEKILASWNNSMYELYQTIGYHSKDSKAIRHQKLIHMLTQPLVGEELVDTKELGNICGKLRCPAVESEYNLTIERIRSANKLTLDDCLQKLAYYQNEPDKWEFSEDFIKYCRELYEGISK